MCERLRFFSALLMLVQIKTFVYKNSVQRNLKRSEWEIIAAVWHVKVVLCEKRRREE